MSCAALLTTLGAVIYFHYSQILILLLGLLSISICLFLWLRDVVRESTYQGFHTKATVNGLKMGFLLFIVSEVLFFVSFFWAFFHSSFLISGQRYVVESDGLLIRNVTPEDAGTYTCRARVMETGSLEERDIKLEVGERVFFLLTDYLAEG